MGCNYTQGATPADQVRLLAADADCTAGTFRFDDVEISTFLTMNAGDVRMAAAQALDVLASEWVNIAGVIWLDDMRVNGADAAAALHAQASELRRQVREGDADGTGMFDIAEMVVDPFTYRQRLFSQALRQSG